MKRPRRQPAPRDRVVFYGRPVKTVKTHSPLFRSVATNLLSRSTDEIPDTKVTQAIKSHKAELRKERKAKKKVHLDAEHNIHVARKREPKTLHPQQTISRSFTNSKPIRHIAQKRIPKTVGSDREVLTEVVNDSTSVTLSTSAMASPATMNGGPNDDYKENDQVSHIMICPDCKEFPPNLTEEFSSGDMVCATCGLVVGDKIVDTRSEWRTFANDDTNNDDPSRVGDVGNPLFEDTVATLQTTIGSEGSNSFHLMKTQQKTVEKGAKNLKEGFSQIKTLTDALQVGNNVRDTAMHIFKLADEKKFLKGKPQEAVIAGCIFVACRQGGVARTFREIFNLTRVSKKEIGRVFKLLEKFLVDIQNEGDKTGHSAVSTVNNFETRPSTNAEDLVRRYVSQLGVRNQSEVESVGMLIAKKTGQVSTLAGRSPLSVAAACIFMATHYLGEAKTSKDIAVVAGVSDGTIKTAYKYLYAEKESLLDAEALQKSRGRGKIERLPSA